MPLTEENQIHLTAAQGFVELGMFLEANEGLEQIDPEVRLVPEVLAVRLQIYRALEKWALMETVAKKLTQYEPEESKWWLAWAFASRRTESIEKAKGILLDALIRHPNDALIHFHLACLESVSGEIESAKQFLHKAIALDGKLRARALEDEDLKRVWDRL